MTIVRSIGKFKYQTPKSLPEVLKILETSTLAKKVLAGGTDLILQMKQGIVRPSLVVDVKQVPELNRLEWNTRVGLRTRGRGTLVSVTGLHRTAKSFQYPVTGLLPYRFQADKKSGHCGG